MLVVFSHAVFVGQTVKSFLAAKTVVRAAQLHQFFGILFVKRFSFALNVRAEAFVFIRTFVVFDTRLFKRAVNKIHRAFDVAFLIGVLDS